MNIKIDPIKAKNKWAPVIENMGYMGNKMEDIACYAENHCNVENLEANIGKNFLPVAMKVISKLKNLDNVNFKIVESSNNHQVNISLDKEEIIEHVLKNGKNSFNNVTNLDAFDMVKAAKDDMSIKDSLDYIQKIESSLVDKAVEKIDNAIASLLSENSEVFFETSVLVKNISINSKPVPNDVPTMDMTISYNLRSKQNEPKVSKYFMFLKEDQINGFDYCLHDKTGDVFFAKKGDELLALPKYETLKYKIDELCKNFNENEPYNYEIIENFQDMAIRIDEEKAEKKWAPVLDNIGYKGTKKRSIAMYCEVHAIHENAYTWASTGTGRLAPGAGLGPNPYLAPPIHVEDREDYFEDQNWLPMSVKILTKLNINNDTKFDVCFTGKENKHHVEIDLTKEEIKNYIKSKRTYTNMDSVVDIETSLRDLAIEKINNDINTVKIVKSLKSDGEVIFETGTLVKSIEVVDNKIRLNLKYTIK